MDIEFMNFRNSKTSDPNRPLLNLTDKINFFLCQIFACTMHGKYKNIIQKQ